MTNTFAHSLFGIVDPSEDDYWEAEVVLGDHTVVVDLNTDLGIVTAESMQRVDWFIEHLSDVERVSREAIRQEHERSDGEARCYQAHHLEEINDTTFLKFVGSPKPTPDDFDGFLALCRLQRLGLYVENSEQFAIADFTVGTDMTDYILSVALDSTGVPRSVSMES